MLGAGLTTLVLKIYAVTGELVATTDAAAQAAPADPLDASGDAWGACSWDLLNRDGARAAPGLYLAVLDAVAADGATQRLPIRFAVSP